MSRLFPPSDIYKKLPIVRSIKGLDIDYSIRSTGSLDNFVLTVPATKKAGAGSQIPTPQYLVVDSYERDYPRSFVQPPSYIRRRNFSERAEFCDSYDLDSDDEDWLSQFNSERRVLPAEEFEVMFLKLEIMDHKAAEKQAWTSTASLLGSPIPVVLTRELAIEVLKQVVVNRPAVVLGAVYDYWKTKREMWQKPILRRFQPPLAVKDHRNPFNVFRPREKILRPHSMQTRRKNGTVQSYEKLREVRYDIESSLELLRRVEQREEKKRKLVEVESDAQRLQVRLKTSQYAEYAAPALQMEDDGGGLVPSKLGRAEDGHRFMLRRDFDFGRLMSMEFT